MYQGPAHGLLNRVLIKRYVHEYSNSVHSHSFAVCILVVVKCSGKPKRRGRLVRPQSASLAPLSSREETCLCTSGLREWQRLPRKKPRRGQDIAHDCTTPLDAHARGLVYSSPRSRRRRHALMVFTRSKSNELSSCLTELVARDMPSVWSQSRSCGCGGANLEARGAHRPPICMASRPSPPQTRQTVTSSAVHFSTKHVSLACSRFR